MKKFLFFLSLLLVTLNAFGKGGQKGENMDTSEVIRLNKQALTIRLTDAAQTLKDASRALFIAQKINYKAGIGESYRMMGIGNYYLNNSTRAIDDYLTALKYFSTDNDLKGEGRVYNNIGTLYRYSDSNLALDYFHKALSIATTLSDNSLIARIYLNIAEIFSRKQSYFQALAYLSKSQLLFTNLNDSVNLVLCLQNKGVVYLKMGQYENAKQLLLNANDAAKKLDLNETIASVDLSLVSLYIAESNFTKADDFLQEGSAFSDIIKDDKLIRDYQYTRYQLETKKKNYKKALGYLQAIYTKDSSNISRDFSTQLNVKLEQVNQQARQSKYELLLQTQKYERVRFWSVVAMVVLLLMLVGILVSNVRRKNKTNTQLTALNIEVVTQKDNLDRINHHLEEIIDERTKDLQVKNKKLFDYSSYLSHQIRGPIATLKGLLNLEREQLVDKNECIRMMNKTVSDIDDKIIEMSDMLHDPGRPGF